MSPAQQIDAQLLALDDWRGERITQLRELIHKSAPELEEAWKWNTGMWTLNGKLVCGYGCFKSHVKLNFFMGAHLGSGEKLFNNGFDAKESRSIDLKEADPLNRAAVEALIVEAVKYAAKN